MPGFIAELESAALEARQKKASFLAELEEAAAAFKNGPSEEDIRSGRATPPVDVNAKPVRLWETPEEQAKSAELVHNIRHNMAEVPRIAGPIVGGMIGLPAAPASGGASVVGGAALGGALGMGLGDVIEGREQTPYEALRREAVAGTVSGAAALVPGAGTIVPPSVAVRAPAAAAAAEVAGHMGIGFATGTGIDALYQLSLNGQVDWHEALKMGGLGALIGGIGGAIRSNEVRQLAEADREGLMQVARKMGFRGKDFDELKSWYKAREAEVLSEVEARDILAKGKQQNARNVTGDPNATPEPVSPEYVPPGRRQLSLPKQSASEVKAAPVAQIENAELSAAASAGRPSIATPAKEPAATGIIPELEEIAAKRESAITPANSPSASTEPDAVPAVTAQAQSANPPPSAGTADIQAEAPTTAVSQPAAPSVEASSPESLSAEGWENTGRRFLYKDRAQPVVDKLAEKNEDTEYKLVPNSDRPGFQLYSRQKDAQSVPEKADPGLVAATEPRESAADPSTKFHLETRVRPLNPDDLNRYPQLRQKYNIGNYVVEQRRVDTTPGGIKPESWQAIDGGKTKEEALINSWDSNLEKSKSLGPPHEKVKSFLEARNKGMADALDKQKAAQAELESLKGEATTAYNAALKKARIYQAAQQNKAPQEKVDTIKAEVTKQYEAKRAAALKKVGETTKAIDQARSLTFNKWQAQQKKPGKTSGLGRPVNPALPAPPPGTMIAQQQNQHLPVTLQRTLEGTIKIQQVHEALENVMRSIGLNTPIRHGRMSERNALGVFKSWSEVIRNRWEYRIPTSAHEVAHALSKKLFGSVQSQPLKKIIPFKPVAAELLALGKKLYGTTRPAAGYTAEGFSELVRLWLTTEDAPKVAPAATAWLENTILKRSPQLEAAMRTARDKIDIWRGQGSIDRIRQQIAREPGRIQKIVEAFKSIATKRMIFERFAPLEELALGYEKITGRTLPADKDPYLIAQAYRRTAAGVLESWVEDGMTDIAGIKVGPSLREAYSRLKPSDDEPFHIYIFAKQALVRIEQGLNPGIERSDAEFAIRELETPEYIDAAAKIAEWWQGVRNYKREAYPEANGPMLDAIEAKNPVYYGPLAADINPEKIKVSAGRRTGGGLYRFKGHGGPTKRMYEQSLFVAENIIGSAQRDLVMRAVVNLSRTEGMGWLVEEVPVTKVMESVNVEKLRAQIEAWDVDTSNIPPDSLLQYATQLDAPAGSDPIIHVREVVGARPDGSPIMRSRWFQVPRQVQEILQGVHEPERLHAVFELFIGAPTRVFKLGATGLRAGFNFITNPERDFQTFMNQSMEVNPVLKVAALNQAYKELTLSAIYDILPEALQKRSGITPNSFPYLESFRRMGISGASFIGGDIARAKREAKGLFHGKYFRILASPVESLREVMSFTESAPRLAEFILMSRHLGWAPNQPMSLEQAVKIRLAPKRVTTDFSAGGAMPPMLQRGLIGPFLNAGIQGARSFGRTFKNNQGTFRRKRAWLVGILNGLSMITLPALWSWWTNKDKEWYRMLPWRERYLYLNIESGNQVIQVPLPQEWGVAFGTLAVASFDSLWKYSKHDPNAARPMLEALKHAFAVINPVDWPTPLAALKEQWQNRVDFFDKPIVPRSEIDLMPGAQRGPYTSWFAKALGDTFPETVSPRRVDAAIREVFGGAGSDYSRAPEKVMELLGLKQRTREPEPADWWFVGRQFRYGGTFSSNNQVLNDFWDDQQRYSAWLASARNAVKNGQQPVAPIPIKAQAYAVTLDAAAPFVSLILRIANNTPELEKRQKLYQRAAELAERITKTKPEASSGVQPVNPQK